MVCDRLCATCLGAEAAAAKGLGPSQGGLLPGNTRLGLKHATLGGRDRGFGLLYGGLLRHDTLPHRRNFGSGDPFGGDRLLQAVLGSGMFGHQRLDAFHEGVGPLLLCTRGQEIGFRLLLARLDRCQLRLGLRLLALGGCHGGLGCFYGRPAPSTTAEASSTPAVEVICVTSAPMERDFSPAWAAASAAWAAAKRASKSAGRVPPGDRLA